MGTAQLDAVAALQRAGTAPRRGIGGPRPGQRAAVPAPGPLSRAYRDARRAWLRRAVARCPRVRRGRRVTPSRLATVCSSDAHLRFDRGARVGDELLDQHLLHVFAHSLELDVDGRLDDGDHLLEFVLAELFLEQVADRAGRQLHGASLHQRHRFVQVLAGRRPGSPWRRLPACPWRRARAAHWRRCPAVPWRAVPPGCAPCPSMPGCCILRNRATSSFLAGDEAGDGACAAAKGSTRARATMDCS